MNCEQLQKDFFPAELTLKLFGNQTQLLDKLTLINNYIEEVRASFDEHVLKIIQNNQIAHIYWMSNHYPEAITHFEIVVENMEAEDSPSKYLLAINLLIRGNRLLSNYKEAKKWIALAFGNSDIFHPFENLINLNDYADLVIDSGKAFDENHIPLIQSIIDKLGFPEKLEDPVKTIQSMTKRNKLWSRKLSEWTIKYEESDLDERIKGIEQYIDSCEIEWYRDYAKNSLEKLKNKKS